MITSNQRITHKMDCNHSSSERANGLALITCIDEELALSLFLSLPVNLAQKVCSFAPDPSFDIQQCLTRHKAAIIVDATNNGTALGTVSIIDGSHLLYPSDHPPFQSCQGLLSETISLARKRGRLPTRIILFGIELGPADLYQTIENNLQPKLPNLVTKLSYLVAKVVETLDRVSS
ncbi:hypothetical protein BH10CYA1_BH10CYA1_13550 [soil metagenome]